MLCVDASKYTDTSWRPSGIGLAIIQAHPPGYGRERSLQLMRVCRDAGVPWDAYIYQYVGHTDWLPGALETLDEAAGEGLVPRKLWLDVEDIDSGKDWSPGQRHDAVWRDLALCDAWVQAHGLPATAIYSAKWYWDPYMGRTSLFSDRQLWAAQYDDVADVRVFTPFGGWTSCRVKQYAGSQPDGTDLDVLSAEEEAELSGQPPASGEPECADLITGLAYVCDSLGDQLLAECKHSSIRKTVVRAIVAEMQRVRADQVGPRP